MKFLVYVWIEGRNFDPDVFSNSLSKKLQGSVSFRKEYINGVVRQVRKHWKSDEIEMVSHDSKTPVQHLHNLLNELKPNLLKLAKGSELTITAEIVATYSKASQVGGVYIPLETIKLLSDIGASLDIDEYTTFD